MDERSERKPLTKAELRTHRVFLALDVVLFVASLTTHLSTFVMTGVSRAMPLYLLLPALPLGMISPIPNPPQNGKNQIHHLKLMSKDWTKQARMILYGLGIYSLATIIFAIFVLNLAGLPTIHDGQYLLWNHGTVIKQLTAQEYSWHSAFELRWTSTIPLYAYYATMMHGHFYIAHSKRAEEPS